MSVSQAVKIALSRRTASPGPVGGAWRVEIFTVTQEVINARKVLLSYSPATNSESIKLNGLELLNNPVWDYTMNGNEIIFSDDALLTIGDTIRARYQEQIT